MNENQRTYTTNNMCAIWTKTKGSIPKHI